MKLAGNTVALSLSKGAAQSRYTPFAKLRATVPPLLIMF
jgi:hypothetical protein